MTPDEINRAIAEHLGWTEIRMSKIWEVTDQPEQGHVLCGLRSDGKLRSVPDYSGDLNAMHEAEMFMRGTLEQYYNDLLRNRTFKSYKYIVFSMFGISAEAKQRAEVFLRIIGKWRDE